MIKNFGFKLNAIKDVRAYRLGAVQLPLTVLQPNGFWGTFLPRDESQITPNYETFACTIYGTENILQILENFHFGVKKEWDERFNYNDVGINPPGADPHDAAESFRKSGVIYGLLPMTETIEEYRTPRPLSEKYRSVGRLYNYELKHDWLFTNSPNKETRTRLIKENLKYSPIGVSVTAWKEKDGVYVDEGQPNTHWCVIYGYSLKGWLLYDSYAPHNKILSYDHTIEVAKRYQLTKKTPQVALIYRLLNKLWELLGLVEKQEAIVPIPDAIVPPVKPQPVTEASKYLWGTKAEAKHSCRVVMDEYRLTKAKKDKLCAVIQAESGFNPKAKNENKRNGVVVSTDWGICQINDYYHIGGLGTSLALGRSAIGAGKYFKSVEEVLNFPEKSVRFMVEMDKLGHLDWWIAYKNKSYLRYM